MTAPLTTTARRYSHGSSTPICTRPGDRPSPDDGHDRTGNCPAPALHVVTMHGQDFYFCGHHTVELAHAIWAHDATGAPAGTFAGDHAALDTRVTGDRMLTVAQPR